MQRKSRDPVALQGPVERLKACVQGVLNKHVTETFECRKKIPGPGCDLNPNHMQSRHALREPHHPGSRDFLCIQFKPNSNSYFRCYKDLMGKTCHELPNLPTVSFLPSKFPSIRYLVLREGFPEIRSNYAAFMESTFLPQLLFIS